MTVAQPPVLGDEHATLTGFLQRQRDLVAWKMGGADDATLRAVSTPTGLTLHGVVLHLTNVERCWIRDRFAGQEGLVYDSTDEDPDGDLHVPAGVRMSQLLSAYADEARLCDEVIAAASLNEVAVRRRLSLRWIILHLIEEISRHLGHIDLLREQADGAVGEEPRPG